MSVDVQMPRWKPITLIVDVLHDEAPELHHPRFLPDDDAILDVATTLVAAYLAGAEIIHLGLT